MRNFIIASALLFTSATSAAGEVRVTLERLWQSPPFPEGITTITLDESSRAALKEVCRDYGIALQRGDTCVVAFMAHQKKETNLAETQKAFERMGAMKELWEDACRGAPPVPADQMYLPVLKNKEDQLYAGVVISCAAAL